MLAIFVMASAYVMLFSKDDGEPEIVVDTLKTKQNQKQLDTGDSKYIDGKNTPLPLKDICSKEQIAAIKKFAYPKWLTFKDKVYSQGISFPVLQLALKDAKAIVIHSSLYRKPTQKQLTKPIFSGVFNKLSQETQLKIYGALLAEGITGIAERIEIGEFPAEILSESPRLLYKMVIGLSTNNNTQNSFPNEEELLLLTGLGLEISVDDYNNATKINAPIEYLELLAQFGPTPESQNFLHEKTPADIAASNSNLKLLEFWINAGLTSNNRLYGGDYSDTLLLKATSSEQFNQAWEFLNLHSKTPTNPDTAGIFSLMKMYA